MREQGGAIAIPKASWGCAPALPNQIQMVSLRITIPNHEPQATENFSVQQFFKNAAEVWASSPHLRSKSNCTIKCNKNLRENRKESQLPSKSEGCNEIQGFRGNCDSQGKLGMCPSLAEPDSDGFSKNHNFQPRAAGNEKSFLIQQFFKNAGEVQGE